MDWSGIAYGTDRYDGVRWMKRIRDEALALERQILEIVGGQN